MLQEAPTATEDPQAPPRLAGGGRDVDRHRRRRRVPGHARRPDRPAPGRVRLVDGVDLRRRLGQPAALRPDRAVRGGADGPVRAAPGDRQRPAAGRGGQRADRLHDRELAAGAVLGRAGRPRHRLDGAGLRRHRHVALVRRPPRPGHRRSHRRRRDRPADLPAGARPGDRGARLESRGADRRRRRAGRRADRGLAAPRLSGRRRAAAVRRHAPRRPCTASRAPKALRGRPTRALSALQDGVVEERLLVAGRRLRDLRRVHQRPGRHALHPGRTRPRPARRPPPRHCWRWSASSTSSARSSPAG